MSDVLPLRSPWYTCPTNVKPIDDESAFVLTPEEEELARRYGLTKEQLNWRRWALGWNLEMPARHFDWGGQDA